MLSNSLNMNKYNKILVLLLIILGIASYGQQNPYMDYVLSWDGVSSNLEVELTYSKSDKDSTVFVFGDPSFGGQEDIFKVIKNIRASKPEEIKINEATRQITIYHNGAKKHRISYEIDGSISSNKPTLVSQTELFRPIIAKGILTLVNKQFTLEVSDNSNPLVSISWRKYPKNFTYFNSVHPSQIDPFKKVTDQYDNFSQNMYFVLGENISVKRYSVMDVPYYSVTTQEDKYGNDLQENLKPFFENYFPSILRFWEDNGFTFYYLAVTALQNNQDEIGAGGFGAKNGFVMKLGTKFGTWEKYVTAHETAHTWIGIKIILGDDSFDNQWFGEGFADYTAIINLINSQIFDKEDFLNYLNEKNLKPHYMSRIKDVHNDSIIAKFWTDYGNYGKLPYRRGFIYAFYLDNQIRLASMGKFTIRNMLLDLYKLRKEKNKDEALTVDDFINVGAFYLDRNLLTLQVQRHMIEGQSIDFKHIKLVNEFKIEINNDVPNVSLTEGADLLKLYRW